ncbi:MAG TPA: hypothetical protein EYP98_07795 [Planctomycetes bacterium]|nr:hypothetical protein [Planctomycetota bacterium]
MHSGLAKAEQFHGNTDSSVVLAALMAWGVDALKRLEGMFAIGFWDASKSSLLLARDRVGIKPL